MHHKIDHAVVHQTSAQLSEIARDAAFGAADWAEIPNLLCDVFDGAHSAILNIDYESSSLNFLNAINVEQSLLDSFKEYYAFISPWTDLWSSLPSGGILNADKVLPVSALKGTEFCTDWLGRIPDCDGAMGLKLCATPNDVIQLIIHYPYSMEALYNPGIEAVFRASRGPIIQSIRRYRENLDMFEDDLSKVTVVNRHPNSAMVIDNSMTLRAANAEAEKILQEADFLVLRRGKLTVKNHRLAAQLADLLENQKGVGFGEQSLFWIDDTGKWKLDLCILPPSKRIGLVEQGRRYLMVVKQLRSTGQPVDISDYAQAHRLTPAEARLCRHLLETEDLLHAASKSGVTAATARQRLKAIFRKTDTNKQSSLLLELSRSIARP
jgi:hypothetical protein